MKRHSSDQARNDDRLHRVINIGVRFRIYFDIMLAGFLDRLYSTTD